MVSFVWFAPVAVRVFVMQSDGRACPHTLQKFPGNLHSGFHSDKIMKIVMHPVADEIKKWKHMRFYFIIYY